MKTGGFEKLRKWSQPQPQETAQNCFQLIRQTGSKGVKVSEVIEEKDGSLISNQKRRLERWAEHFQSHFSNCQQPQPDSHPNTLPVSVWTVSNEPPTETEVRDAIKTVEVKESRWSR